MLGEHRLLFATVTPFTSDLADVDESQLDRMVRTITAVDTGAAPLVPVVNGEAGEVHALSRHERRRVVGTAVAAAAAVPVFAGVTGSTTRQAVQAAEDAIDAGAQGLYVLPPYGAMDLTVAWDTSHVEPLLGYLAAIAAVAGDTPLVPHPTAPYRPEFGFGWPLRTVRAVLDAVPNVTGWKMMYPYEAYQRVGDELRSRGVAILATNALYFHEYLASERFDGTCTGSWGYAIEPMLGHLDAWRANDLDRARAVWNGGLRDLHRYARSSGARLHARGKLGAWLAGLVDSPRHREPATHVTAGEVRTLHGLMAAAGVRVRPAEQVEALARSLHG